MQQAIKDANLSEEDIQDPDSGLYTSSGGSMRSIHKHFEKMDAEESWPVILLRLLPQLQEL